MALKITKKVTLISLVALVAMGGGTAAFAYIGTIHYGRVTVYNGEPSDIRGQSPLASYNVTSSTALEVPALARHGWTCTANWTRPTGIDMSCRHEGGVTRRMRVNCPRGSTDTIIAGSLGLYTDRSQLTVRGRCVEKQVQVMD